MKHPTFPLYTDRCGFNALLPPRAASAPAKGDITADYVVVGAGYTGLAAARRGDADQGAQTIDEALRIGQLRPAGFAP